MQARSKIWLGAAFILAACGSDSGSGPNAAGTLGTTPGVMMPSPTSAGTAGAAAMSSQSAPPVEQPVAGMPNTAPPAQPMQNAAMNMPTTMMMPPTGQQPPATAMPDLDECALDTQWPGDEYCILPPPSDKGFQVHIGPTNYDNPEPSMVMEPGNETTVNISATSGNDKDIYYYYRQYRMRPGSHHWIVTANGRRLGGTQNLAKDNPDNGVIAPENAGVGMPLPAHAQLGNSLHYYNFTDKPIIKEVWMNVWYRDAKDVKEPSLEMFSMLGMGIGPGEHVVKHGSCPITGTGRMLTVYGHVHAHNKRFSAWRVRGGEKLLLHQAFDWEHPSVSEFSSITMNPALVPGSLTDGGYSGVVDLKPGDTIEFECDIVNDTNSTFVGLNEAQDDEMCILVGDTVGAQVPGRCTASTLPATN
jgi:hypothetical protein